MLVAKATSPSPRCGDAAGLRPAESESSLLPTDSFHVRSPRELINRVRRRPCCFDDAAWVRLTTATIQHLQGCGACEGNPGGDAGGILGPSRRWHPGPEIVAEGFRLEALVWRQKQRTLPVRGKPKQRAPT